MATNKLDDTRAAKLGDRIREAILSGNLDNVSRALANLGEISHRRQIDHDVYPDLNGLTLNARDIDRLMAAGVLARRSDGFRLTAAVLEYVREKSDPLLTLLYAHCWKLQGLAKTGNIAAGVLGEKDPSRAPVLFYLGRHLASAGEEPLIDQHAIRAYRFIFTANDRSKVRTSGFLTDEHQAIIAEYKEWFRRLTPRESCFLRAVDELLMGFGQVIKLGSKGGATDEAEAV